MVEKVVISIKTYNNLYEKICDIDNIKLAIKKASIGKKHRSDVNMVLDNIFFYAQKLQSILINEIYILSDYTEDTVVGGTNRKKRNISKPKFFPDQCIHWAIYLQVRDIFTKSFYNFSCGSVPDKGPHYAKRHIQKWIINDRKNTKYYLKLDIKQFYPSITSQNMKLALRKKFRDKRLLKLLDAILDKHRALPIGILLSQWFANFYVTPIDFFIKQILKIKYYIRYMDDMILFSNNKKYLHKVKKILEEKFAELGLSLKANWQVCKLEKEPLDFIGFKFYKQGFVLIRKSILYKITRAARRIYKLGLTFRRGCSIMSYLGYLAHTNSHNLYITRIKPYINIRQIKKMLRRKNKNGNFKFRKYSISNRMGYR